jgi:hypothetical protein
LPQDIHTGATPTFARLIANGTTSSGTTSSIHTNWLTIFPANGATGNVKFFLNNGTQVWETFNNSSGVYGVYNNTADTQPFEIKTNATNAGLSLQSGGPITKNIAPLADSTYTNGTSSLYWSNTYTDRLYLNSTAYIDGASAGQAELTGKLKVTSTAETQININSNGTLQQRMFVRTSDSTSGWYDVTQSRTWLRHISGVGAAQSLSLLENGGYIGINMAGTTAPTHSLTLGSTSTGIALYNTADQTTNFERVRAYWNSNVYTINSEVGGTGTIRGIQIGNSLMSIVINYGGNDKILFTTSSSGAGAIGAHFSHTQTNSSSLGTSVSITPTVNQSGTAGYTALLINPTETATGSGAKNLIDAQVGGASKFKVTNTGMAELGATGEGIVMKSPDGTRYKLTIANGGTVSVSTA